MSIPNARKSAKSRSEGPDAVSTAHRLPDAPDVVRGERLRRGERLLGGRLARLGHDRELDGSAGNEGREAIGQILVDSGNSSIGIDLDRSCKRWLVVD